MTKFNRFIGNLKNQTENLIWVTLKHLDGLHNQKRHGWRYGANLLMPNGIGKPSIDRAKSYLAKVMTRDLATRVTYNKKTKTGRSNLRNKIQNTHMEFQRRTRSGTRRAGIKVDPKYGKNLGDVDRNQSAMKITKGTKREQLKTKVADRWASYTPALKNPLGGKGDSNRVNPKTGRANPRKNDEPYALRKKVARTDISSYRKGTWTPKKDVRRAGEGPIERQQGKRYMATYNRANASPNVSSATNFPFAKGAGGPTTGKKRGPKGTFGSATATKELRNNILETLEKMFYDKTNG